MVRTAHVIGVVALLVIGLVGFAAPASAAPPPNDDVDDATVIDALPFIDTIDTSEATSAPDDPDCFESGRTVWYAFTPTEDVIVEATTVGSRYDTTLSAWTGTRGNLDPVACNDDAPEGLHSRIVFSASAGTTYYLMAGAFSGGPGGRLILSAYEAGPAPDNDDIDQATPVPALPFTDQLDTSSATRAPDDPTCLDIEDGTTVWYSFTPARTMLVEADTFGSDYDTTLSAWTGERGDLRERACNDDQGDDVQSQVLFVARAGTTYHLMVGSFGVGPGGMLNVSVAEVPRGADGFTCPTDIWLFDDVSGGSVHANGIRCGAYLEIVRGYEDGTFRPDRGVRRDQMASFLVRTATAAGLELPAAQHAFTDVRGNTHEEAIGQLAAAGIVRGTTATTYAPDRIVSRDQMASYLVRTLEWERGEQLTAPRSPFVDIGGNTHQRSIDVAYDQGITVGRTATTYGPRADVRRDQAATFTTRLLARMIDD